MRRHTCLPTFLIILAKTPVCVTWQMSQNRGGRWLAAGTYPCWLKYVQLSNSGGSMPNWVRMDITWERCSVA
jgi:hypothetical protein